MGKRNGATFQMTVFFSCDFKWYIVYVLKNVCLENNNIYVCVCILWMDDGL